MKRIWAIFTSILVLVLCGCSPVKLPVRCQYQLSEYCVKACSHASSCRLTLMVSVPEAESMYQTTQMFYVTQPFLVNVFAYNAWISPPTAMLYSLLVKSLQSSGFFYAVTSNAYGDDPDFRLDTHLLTLEQNFLKKPSEIEFSAKVVLTHVRDNHVLASQIFNIHVPCPSEDPYGGVVAANKAVLQFTAGVNEMVMAHIR